MPTKPKLRKAFKLVRPTIIWTCKKFCQRHGYDLDLAVSDSYYYFLTKYKEFDPEKSSLRQWTRKWIYMALMSAERRKKKKEEKIEGMVMEAIPETGDRGRKFSAEIFAENLSDHVKGDVITVIGILFDGSYLSLPSPTKTRVALKDHLKHKLYWKRSRVASAFAAIRKALKEN